VAAPVGKHIFAALLSEGIEALAAHGLQLVALAVDQLVAAGRSPSRSGAGAWSDGGGCRATGPGFVEGGSSGHRPCWDPFWSGRLAAAANPAPGVAVPPQSIPATALESSTPIEVTRHGRTIGLYVPLPQQGNLSDREKVLEAGRLMQAELERLGLSEDELSADFKAWRKGRREQATA
jgi:hypothetical protein